MRGNFSDKIFLLRLQHQRDPEVFARFYDSHVDSIYRFVYLKVSSQQVAEDVTSEAFLKTWQYINDATEEIQDMRAFLYRVARNLVIDHYRQKAKSDMPMEDEVLDSFPALAPGAAEKAELQGDMEYVRECIGKLKNEYQEALLLRHIDGLGISEIAAVLGKKRGAVRVLLHRAMKTLKTVMDTSKQ